MTVPLMFELLVGYVVVCCLALWLASKILP
jgi:hypothetical protein